MCDEEGQVDEVECEHCKGTGRFELDKCPRKYVGEEITEAINVAGMCQGGIMPVAGGLFDQSSWFLSLWQLLQSEENKIEHERIKRSHG